MFRPSVNSHHVNTAITFTELEKAEMLKLGFRHSNMQGRECWSYLRDVSPDGQRGYISIWIRFPTGSKNQDDLHIDVIDEEFGQPYDYQHILEKNPKFEYARAVREKVEAIMDTMQKAGVLSGHEKYDYI